MVKKIFSFDDVQSKKFLGNTVEQKANGTITLEELEITSRLVVDVPNGVNIQEFYAYVSSKDKVVVEVELENQTNEDTPYIEQEFILEYFDDNSFYKWKDIKERCFDEEMPAVLMEYGVFFEEPHSESVDNEDKSIPDMRGAKATLEMTVRLKRNKKQNAHNERIVQIISEEILPNTSFVKDLFIDNEKLQKSLQDDIRASIRFYLRDDKKVNGVTANAVARIISKEAYNELKGNIKVQSAHTAVAQYLSSELFTWNTEAVLEMDSKQEVAEALKRIANRIFASTTTQDLLYIPEETVHDFVDRNEDKIKEVLKEVRESSPIYE